MKLKSGEIASFINSPPKTCRAFLFYGQDAGLARAQYQDLLKSLKIDSSDPFAITPLDNAQVLSEPSLLHDALSAMSLMGDAPCVLLRDGGNRLTEIIKSVYSSNIELNYLFIIAGELDGSSSLRALFEKEKNMAAIACYRAEGKDLAMAIRAELNLEKINASADAVQLLSSMLGNDRGVLRSEIQKISLYLGENRTLTPEIVLEVCADNQNLMLHESVLQCLAGDKLNFYRNITRLLQTNENMVATLRVIQYYLFSISAMVQKCAQGARAEEIVASARPFINFNNRPLYIRAINRFKNPADLMHAHHKIAQLEVMSKTTGAQDFMLLQELLHF